jgi:hypothetical protein
VRREELGQGGEHSAVGPVQLGPGVLPPKYGYFVTQHQSVESDGPSCPDSGPETTSRVDAIASWAEQTMTAQ